MGCCIYLFIYLFILLLAEIELQHLTNFYLFRRRSHAKITIDVKNMKATKHYDRKASVINRTCTQYQTKSLLKSNACLLFVGEFFKVLLPSSSKHFYATSVLNVPEPGALNMEGKMRKLRVTELPRACNVSLSRLYGHHHTTQRLLRRPLRELTSNHDDHGIEDVPEFICDLSNSGSR